MIQLFSNNFITTIASTVAAADLTISVTDASGMNAPGTDEYELVTLYDGTDYEIVQVTGVSGNVLTVVRAQESTSALDLVAGDTVFSSITAATISSLRMESLAIAVSDESSSLQAGTGKASFRMPYGFTLSEVRCSVSTAPTGTTPIIVDINVTGVTILSTKLSIDLTELTSTTAATPVVISSTSIADDAVVSIDIDQVGDTIAGIGLKVYLIGQQA